MHNAKESSSYNKNRDPEWFTSLNRQLKDAHPDEILEWGVKTFGRDVVLGTGFGLSGMVLIHRIHALKLNIPVFYLDTHLLFEETYSLRDQLKERFDIEIVSVSPKLSLEEQAKSYGEKLWENDPNTCCHLRKVLPLRRYLSDKKAWISGVRRDQSNTRKQTQIVEWDPDNNVVKINPLASWTGKEVWSYIRVNELPYNPLHDEGYPSIGCIPCTHPVGEDEDERAGRWRGSEKTECGIHTSTQAYPGDGEVFNS